MCCWVQFRRKLQQPIVGHAAIELKNTTTHQLVESNVMDLNSTFQASQAHVRERVASWLENSIDCATFSSEESEERSNHLSPDTHLPWHDLLEKCESSYSGFSDFN
jgi:hypothetical protein